MNSDILSGLNPAQLKAVTHQGTPLLVLAGAGSGKTRVLTHRAAYFVDQKLATPDQILLLTFTNKAAQEMKDRMGKLLPATTMKLWAGTFHSFACRLLRLHGSHVHIDPNFTIYDTDDQENLLRTVLTDMNLSSQEFKPSSVLYFIESAKNSYLSPDALETQMGTFWESMAIKIYRQYQKKMAEYQALDFNDLLVKSIDLLNNFPQVLDRVQDKYRFILVDEYQDTNQIQYLLTKLLAGKYRQITAVGDASQSIYGWRGADYRNLNSFTQDFPDATVINLEQNYRSTQTILEAANAIISQNHSHPVLKLFTEKKSAVKIKLFEADSEVSEADYISQKIQDLHQNYHFEYKDIAVLYRMNAQSEPLKNLLRYNIPYVLIGGVRFYERAEIKDIIAMLRVAANPSDLLSVGRVQKALGKTRYRLFNEQLENLNLKK